MEGEIAITVIATGFPLGKTDSEDSGSESSSPIPSITRRELKTPEKTIGELVQESENNGEVIREVS